MRKIFIFWFELFTRNFKQIIFIAVPKCKDFICQNEGECKETQFNAYCDCKSGFGGNRCEIGKIYFSNEE